MTVKSKETVCERRAAIAAMPPSGCGSTERVRKLNARLLSIRPRLCLVRARAYTDVFKTSGSDPAVIRVAKSLAKTLRDLPPVIEDGELIVGAPGSRLRAAVVIPEIIGGWLRKDIDELPHRVWDPFEVSPEEVKDVKEILDFWQGNTLYDYWSAACPPEVVRRVIGTGWAAGGSAFYRHGYHFTPPWEILLSKGLVWYEDQVNAALKTVEYDNPRQMESYTFWRALAIVVEAIHEFATKYSRRAAKLSELEKDPVRRAELLEISAALNRVPYHGASSFREALQAIYFVMALLHIEGTGTVYTLGRVDQYLYPFYKADIASGRLTPELAQELIECLFIKLTGNINLSSNELSKVSPGYKQTQAISLGGIDAQGKDATNELTYLFLDAAGSVRTIQPDIALLCHPRETPYAIKKKGADLVALGLGIPKFYNTETLKTELMNLGYTTEEASVGWIQGCTEPYGPGCKQYGHSAGSWLNLPMCLEVTLYNGRKRMPGTGSGTMIGAETGDCRNFRTFDDFFTAVKTQITCQIRDGHITTNWVELIAGSQFPLLFQSLLTDACIERGVGATAGGARINVGPGIAICGGVATLADSLSAIKKLVFDEKKISMDEMLRAIDTNFDGYETLRGMLLRQAPKFGNDIDYVDDIARELFQFVNNESQKLITTLGNKNIASTCLPVSNILGGARTWATPDGRKAGAPFSNHIGPTDGMDVNGPVAHINSVTKLDMGKHFGAVHNMYFVNVDSEEKVNDMVNLIDLFLARGGYHLQINCQDKQVFIDAQKHPENHAGLMVRVAGYVAYFVELPKELQDQIIARTDLCV